ncbi:MAG: rRNA maturation RNase YbeY [bacterium]|nr:MAG: rRNA maturation RNase YbeY [bacterium]
MVRVLIRSPEAEPLRRMLRDLASRILSDLGRAEAELSILVTDDGQVRSLNRQYRGKDSATDVLSFSQSEGEGPQGPHDLLGDVVISWDSAVRQSEQYGHGVRAEVARLMVHGILHLLGYDHEDEAESSGEMRALEERYARRRRRKPAGGV